jgi:antitoxin component YwqK of YwqJK toxin-antitoxin module
MKINSLFFAIALFGSLFLACNTAETSKDNDLVEQIDSRYASGKVKSKRKYKQQDEAYIPVWESVMQESGELLMEGPLNSKGEKNGLWKSYYPNGNVWSEGEFKDGLDHGIRKAYYENGQKRFEGKYENGRKRGMWIFWDENGRESSREMLDK